MMPTQPDLQPEPLEAETADPPGTVGDGDGGDGDAGTSGSAWIDNPRLRRTARAFALDPASTRHELTRVAPFQLK